MGIGEVTCSTGDPRKSLSNNQGLFEIYIDVPTRRGGNLLKFCRQEVASFWRQRIVCRQNNPDVIIT